MSTPEILMFVVVLLLIPAARHNWTAGTLAGGYLLIYAGCMSGAIDPDHPFGPLFMVDTGMLALIYCKALRSCRTYEYDSVWHQLRCIALELTPYDRAIVGIFIFVTWPGYVAGIPLFHKWWLLYLAALCQYLLAGLESFLDWRRTRARVNGPDNPSSGSLRIAWAGSGQWST